MLVSQQWIHYYSWFCLSLKLVKFWILPVRDFVLSGFCPFRIFSHSGFCPIRDFVQFGILFFGILSFRDFVRSRFCPIRDFVQFGILFFGILSVNASIFQCMTYVSIMVPQLSFLSGNLLNWSFCRSLFSMPYLESNYFKAAFWFPHLSTRL